jgi:hypothetical protein
MDLMVPCEIGWEDTPSSGFLVNISMEAALLSAERVPPAGSVVKIKLKLPHNQKPFETEGQVIKSYDHWTYRHRPGRFAVRLLRAGPELVALIAGLSNKKNLHNPAK